MRSGASPDPVELAQRRDTAARIALEAAAILVAHRARLGHVDGRRDGVTYKGQVDLVTAADRASEAFVVAALAAAFPHDRIVGEEGGGAGPADALFVWYVDPLDGTTNFVHGLPHFAVSLGVVHDGVPVAGVVHAPLAVAADARTLGVTWAAAAGQGATKNGVPIRVSPERELQRALAATGFPYDRTTTAAALVARVERALTRVHCIRRLGSAALDLAHVADGTFGVYWEPRLKPWDLAAGVVLVREAGGRVTDHRGGDAMLETGDVLASNGLLHDGFLRDVLGA